MGLPNTYLLLDYLESTGDQYLDLGLQGDLYTIFRAEVEMTEASTSNSFTLFGDKTTNNSAVSFSVAMNTTQRISRFGDTQIATSSAFMSYNERHKIKMDKAGIWLDSAKQGTFNATTNFTTTNNLYLFRVNGIVGTDYYDGKIRVYSATISNNRSGSNITLRNLVPAKRIADDVLGMYDLANDVFYTNAGTGTFGYSQSQDKTEDISLIPIMTSNSAPYGTVSQTDSKVYYDFRGATYNYSAFDGVTVPDGSVYQKSLQYKSEDKSQGFVMYTFTHEVRLHKIKAWLNGYGQVFEYRLQYGIVNTNSGTASLWFTSIVVGNLPQSSTAGAAGFNEYTAVSSSGVNAVAVRLLSNTKKVSGTNLYCTEIGAYRTVHAQVSPVNSGVIRHELDNSNIKYTAEAVIDDYIFSHWENQNHENVSTSSSYTLTTDAADDDITAVFYHIDLSVVDDSYQPDSTLGTAEYEYVGGSSVWLTALHNNNSAFLGWLINDNFIPITGAVVFYEYTLTGDSVIKAVFKRIYEIEYSCDGNGAMSYTRGVNTNTINDIEFTVLPDTHWHFVKYVINGSDEYTATPLNLSLTDDISIVAYFEEDDKLRVQGLSNVEDASIYVSSTRVLPNTVVTVYARPLADYYFVKWDDGITDNPRQITVTADITMMAIYQRMPHEQNVFPYRCYIKDQLHLTDPPKSFLKVDNFDIKTDLLTNANSTITAFEKLPENINDGDVLVLYDPRGVRLYQGVIKSMQDKQITCSQMQSFYKGTWVFNHHSSSTTLEAEVAYLLGQYAQGKMYNCSWTDTLVAQRLGGINILFVGSTSANLPTDYDYSTIDMEDFIYSLYEDYGIIFSFEINFSGTNYVTIKVPDYDTVKVGDNMFGIRNMSPVTTTEETNKLIVYSSNNTYRTTYIATTNGIVETPSTNANRFNITNTTVVFSDDTISDIVSANLPSTMYNHKLTFELLIKNFIYEFNEFKLGGSLDVWNKDDYYNTVLTGYEIRKDTNQAITSVLFTCGKVRTALTKKLTMGVVK